MQKSLFQKSVTPTEKNRNFLKKHFYPYNRTFGIFFGPSDAEFQEELGGTLKYIHQKCPKDRDSDEKTMLY